MTVAVDIHHTFNHFRLDVRFQSNAGITALFGRSGSGKTTVINVIAGLIQPLDGRIMVDGETLLDTSRAFRVPKHRRRIGYVFQDARLFPHFTVRQNLLYGRWFFGWQKNVGEVDHVVSLLGIEKLLDRYPDRLSGGEKQRVAIGRALLSRPRLLLMDEPLAALDHERKAEILPYLERLRDETKVPIIYVSHSMTEVRRLAEHLIVLSDGQVASAGPASIMGGLAVPSSPDVRCKGRGHASMLASRSLNAPNGRMLLP